MSKHVNVLLRQSGLRAEMTPTLCVSWNPRDRVQYFVVGDLSTSALGVLITFSFCLRSRERNRRN